MVDLEKFQLVIFIFYFSQTFEDQHESAFLDQHVFCLKGQKCEVESFTVVHKTYFFLNNVKNTILVKIFFIILSAQE